MKRVVVITDSAANLPADLVRQLDIHIIPVGLAYRGKAYRDGVDITAGELYRWLRANKHVPTTAAPSLGDFVREYAAVAEYAGGIVCIHLSPRLSAIYASALAASELVDGVPIRVMESGTAAMAMGFVVLEAARAAWAAYERGDPAPVALDAVIARAEEIKPKVELLAIFDNLAYLHRGGRIGAATALMGSALQISPVIQLANGQVEPVARPRTRARAKRFVLEEMARRIGDRPAHIAVFHADTTEDAEETRQEISERFDCRELYVVEFTPVMGVHTGPGCLGVAFYAEG